jgi:hypothetical protein
MVQFIGVPHVLSNIIWDFLNNSDKEYYRGDMSDNKKCEYAEKNGYLELLKESHENGCSWDNTYE